MKLRFAVVTILCIGLCCGFIGIYAQGKKAAPAAIKAVVMPKITVLNPMGTPPPVTVKPMAEPLSTLDGKTIYLVNTGFVNTERLMEEYKKWFQANYPKTTIVDQRAGMSNLPAALKKELQEKADGVIFALGHWSVCAPGAVRLAIEVQADLKKPAVPVLLSEFEEQETNVALLAGMPKVRIHYIRGPIWAKTNEQIKKQVIEGKSPVTGKPAMAEMVEMLTKPLTAEEKKTGEIKRDRGPATYTGTPDELQNLFMEKRYTDFMPIILPTEEKVNEMLKGTSHAPEEVVGRMNPGSDAGDTWSYTVKDCAVNAVMAGAKPEYFPLILAIASGNMTSINISDNGFAAAAVVNGKIREEIKLNYDVGAVGPYAHANVAIGRAWNLISINGGNCGKIGTTYMGTVGNAQNALATIIAENEENSPFEPLAVRRSNSQAGSGYGFGNAPGGASAKYQKGDNVVTLLTGWGVLSAANWKVNRWQSLMDYPKIIKDIHEQQNPGLFGTFFILSPPIANFVKDAGYDTVEKLNKYATQPDPAAPPAAAPAAKPGGRGGFGAMGGSIELIVAGASNNNYWMAGGLRPGQAIAIDKWR